MSIINIVIFTSTAIFVLLLFFNTFYPSPSATPSTSSMYPMYSTPMSSSFPFLGAVEDDERKTDATEQQFIENYNKLIKTQETALKKCNENRGKLNQAIEKLRSDALADTNTSGLLGDAIQKSKMCSDVLISRIPKYITAYEKKYGNTLTNQQVITRIATNALLQQ